ncbi:class I adenylate-forming enzyme family protein [Mycolicibacterium palauense]|uniref:class I adenylate-forming enzyme family protein n=1 Tax=Mycolicibacterium palauense TaxID=2034511 RepID=UPI000BFECA46|nr:AMP-binding protein [Mycolicibacterium palauense]
MTGRRSFGRVLGARAAADPGQIVVISDHEGVRLSAAELDSASNRLAREYLARGVTTDSLVTVALPNGAEFVVVCMAIWKAGATPSPLPPGIDAGERAELEGLARPALAVGAAPVDPTIPWLPAGFVARRRAGALPDAWPSSWKAPASSGSTGRPKLVVATAPALVDPDRPVAPFLPLRATQLVTAPLWHSAQFTYAFRGLLTGHRLVLTDAFDEHRFEDLVARHRISWALLSPSDIHRLVRRPPMADTGTLETVVHLGAPCPPADKRALIERLGASRVVEVYAGSESNGLTMITGDEWLQRPGSVGRPISGTAVRIQCADGTPAPTGQTGQIWMRRTGAPGYRYLGARSRRTADGWDTLGDLGFVDAAGYLTVVDRAADVIDNAGTAVYPSRVEHALSEHPAVRESVAVADPVHGVAAVVDIGEADLDAQTLIDFAGARLSPAERPARIDIRRSPLRNHAGKVRRCTFRSPSSTS